MVARQVSAKRIGVHGANLENFLSIILCRYFK